MDYAPVSAVLRSSLSSCLFICLQAWKAFACCLPFPSCSVDSGCALRPERVGGD